MTGELLRGLLSQVHDDVNRLTLLSLNRAGACLERMAGGWQLRLAPLVDMAGEPTVGTSLGVAKLALAQGVELEPRSEVSPGTFYVAWTLEDLEVLAELPPAPVRLVPEIPVRSLPALDEAWGRIETLWRQAPQVKVVGAFDGWKGVLHRLVRLPNGRAEARVSGHRLEDLTPLVGDIERVIGWGPEIEAWCARHGLAHREP